jgi:hypothetical protein
VKDREKGIEGVLFELKVGNSKFPIFHGKRRHQIWKRGSSFAVKDREKGIEDVLFELKIGNSKFPIFHCKRRHQIWERRSSFDVKDREKGIEGVLFELKIGNPKSFTANSVQSNHVCRNSLNRSTLSL